ncbi:MAG TPA: hypothetical protein VF794_32605 [Archangium sp.]|jgi:hypothetical protein|uniref:hypothetical protein n=1 Tax=Archangium sp. TaxID=1872627 RepID=UPI002ED7A127
MVNRPSCWLKLPLLLSLLLLVPGVGLAAQDAPLAAPETPTESETPFTDSGIPGTDEPEPLRLLDEPESQRSGTPLGLRILAEVGAGTVTSLGGTLVGGLLGLGLCEALDGQGEYVGCAWGAVLGAVAGAGIGYPVGVWWGGEVTGGDGKLFAAIVGMALGSLVGLVVGVAAYEVDATGRLTGVAAGLATMAGPIIAYELSQNREPRPPRQDSAEASARPRVQPLLSVTSRGAVLGLGGSF